MENKDTWTVGNKIIGVLFIIWFLGSFAGLIYSAIHKNTWLALVIVGQLLLIGGVALTVSLVRDKQASALAVGFAALVGAILLAAGLIVRFGSEEAQRTLSNLFPAFFGGIFLIVGLTGWIAPAVWKKRQDAKYTEPVEAVCIEVNEKPNGKSVLSNPVYRITRNGKQYDLNNYVFRSGPAPEVGETRTLYIDENDVGGYFDPDEYASEKGKRIAMRILFGAFVVVGGLVLFVSFSGILPTR